MRNPLNVCTDYSLMQSLITIPKLMDALSSTNSYVCGICDDNLYGTMEFFLACKSHNIKPLIGLKIKLNDTYLYLYPKNNIGYKRLLKINTLKEENNLVLNDILKDSHELLIVVPVLFMSNYEDVINLSNTFVAYTSDLEKYKALEFTSRVIFMPEINIFNSSDSSYLRLLKAIDSNTLFKKVQEEDNKHHAWDFYTTTAEIEEEIECFASLIELDLSSKERYIPRYNENIDSNKFLQTLAFKGLQKRLNGKEISVYKQRLTYELNVIEGMGFSDYFLIVYDYVLYAKKNGILVGPGRGSAVGSLVSYSIGITDVDPLKYNLIFERFLNPSRVTMPDIDIDFEETRRGEVVEYVKKRYGPQNVSGIITFGTLKSKLVLRCVSKALGLDTEMDKFINMFSPNLSLKDNLKDESIRNTLKENESFLEVVKLSLKLEGLKKHTSSHAAGIVISSVPLDEIIPVHVDGSDLLAGFTMNYLEDLGLLKMDFLSLRNLTTLKNILSLIKKDLGITINLNKIPLDDKDTYKAFSLGKTMGVFQFESEGMKSFLKKLKPDRFSLLVAAIALYRPGPMENIDEFIRRKEGKASVTYIDKSLEPILKETYGIIIYQEQVMQILVSVGGFSNAQSDTIRRAMSKKKKEIITSYEEKFVCGAINQGIRENVAKEIFSLILKFAGYGFNKSHSVSYSLLGYQMAYLKVHYFLYFITNALNNVSTNPLKTKEYLAMAKQNKIKIYPPDINSSTDTYQVENGAIRLPLSVIKGLGAMAIKEITEERKKKRFTDFFDFTSRVYGKSVNSNTLKLLILSSAFDTFKVNHKTLLQAIPEAINYAALSSGIDESLLEKPDLIYQEDSTDSELRNEEMEVFGFYLSNHPASKYISKDILKLENVSNFFLKNVMCVVLIENIRVIKTKDNKDMAFLRASDETGELEFVVFPNTIKELENISVSSLVLIRGKVSKRFDTYQITVNKIEKIQN